jgi:Photosystem I reaction centre subunit XI
MGPFVKLGPLRDSDIGLLAGFLSTIGLILILTLGLTIYGVAAFGQDNLQTTTAETDLQTRKAWDQFKGGFFVGACGSAGFAFICLSSIPTFTTN